MFLCDGSGVVLSVMYGKATWARAGAIAWAVTQEHTRTDPLRHGARGANARPSAS